MLYWWWIQLLVLLTDVAVAKAAQLVEVEVVATSTEIVEAVVNHGSSYIYYFKLQVAAVIVKSGYQYSEMQ